MAAIKASRSTAAERDASCPTSADASAQVLQDASGPARHERLAYANPPYPGNARLYRDHPDYGGEVDHAELIRRLQLDYDGWALSTSAEALPAVLALCPRRARRGMAPRRTATWSAWPLHAWEPVIYSGGRQLIRNSGESRRADSIVCGVSAVTTLSGPGHRREASGGVPVDLRAAGRRAG